MVFGRFRRRTAEPLREPLNERQEALAGTMTASESVRQATRIIASLDPDAYPVRLSTADIDESGRSPTWEVNFASESLAASLWVDFSPDSTVVRGLPHLDHRPESFMPKLWAGLKPAQRRRYLHEWFKYPPLANFVDSPDAISRLRAENAAIDLVSGSTNLSLATDRTTEVWRLSVGREHWELPLHR